MNHFNDHMNRLDIPIPFEKFFKSNFRPLCYFAFQFLNNMAEAEDVVQDTFIKFWDKKDDFKSEHAIKSFLYVSVKNACLNIKRHKLVIQNHVETQPADLYIDHPEVLNNIVKAEVLARIYRAVETLPDGCKKIFEMSYFEELKNPQIAEILEITVNTVKTQKYRAIKLLNEKLNPIFKSQAIETTFFTAFFYFL